MSRTNKTLKWIINDDENKKSITFIIRINRILKWIINNNRNEMSITFKFERMIEKM